MLWSRAAVFSLQLLDPKRVVKSAAAAGNWRFGRLVSVMASKVQINSSKIRKKKAFSVIKELYSTKVPVGYESNLCQLLSWQESQVIFKRKQCWIQRVFFVMSVFLWTLIKRLTRRSIIDNPSIIKSDIHFRFSYPVSEWGLDKC